MVCCKRRSLIFTAFGGLHTAEIKKWWFLVTMFVRHLFCPLLLRRAPVWVWAGSYAVGENVTQTRAQQPIILLLLTFWHHLRRKIWSSRSSLAALSKALRDEIVLCFLRLCISARHDMLHKHSLVVMWCHQWKLTVLYTSGLKKKKDVKACHHYYCFVVVQSVYRKKKT